MVTDGEVAPRGYSTTLSVPAWPVKHDWQLATNKSPVLSNTAPTHGNAIPVVSVPVDDVLPGWKRSTVAGAVLVV
jgi:hypothetical protein